MPTKSFGISSRITLSKPGTSSISITYDGVDITTHVKFSDAKFEAQASGGVGTCSFTLIDKTNTLNIVTGKEIVLTLDGVRYWGGYVMQVGHGFAFPVVDTDPVSSVTARQWFIQGANYNILFDRLITRNTSDYLRMLPEQPYNVLARDMVKYLAAHYLDIPAGFDTTTYVDANGYAKGTDVNSDADANGPDPFIFRQQGSTWREQLKYISLFNGGIYYLDASKNLHYHNPEKLEARWGFSDKPNKGAVSSSDTTWKGALYGMRDLSLSTDINSIIDDVFVWGGSQWAAADQPVASGIVFARRTNEDSVAKYGRWQQGFPFTNGFQSQGQVDSFADKVVFDEGVTGTTSDVKANQSVPAWTAGLSWFGHDVPILVGSGAKDHLIPGQIVPIILYVHGEDITHPLTKTLILRRVSISFPTLPTADPGTPRTYVQFQGDFGLSLDDPFSIWEAILQRRGRTTTIASTAGSSDLTGSPGGLWQGAPDQAPDGSRTTFSLSSESIPIVYVPGSSVVSLNALALRLDVDYSEDPLSGTITVFVAPTTGSVFRVSVRLAG